MTYDKSDNIQEAKKPLPKDKMSLKAASKDMSAQKEVGCEKRGNCDRRDKLENQARMIRMAMDEQKSKLRAKVHGVHEVPSTNLASLVKKAVKRIDTDVDGDVDKNDPSAGDFGEYVPSPDGKKRIYTQVKEACENCGECDKCGKKECKCDICPVCDRNPCVCSEEIKEAIRRLDAAVGNLVFVEVYWRGRNFVHKMFFAQAKFPTRKQVLDQINKVYPGCRLIRYKVTDFNPGMLLQVREGIDKDAMACNKPKAQAVGDSQTGKSHVVKACAGGKEKIIRFGQRGVKGSPKKEGESEAYKKRREAFKSRHAKNIAKGKMSAAYWSDRTKW